MTISLPAQGLEPWDAALNTVLSQVGNTWLPDDYGWAAWTYDPAVCAGSEAITNGTHYLARMNVRRTVNVDSIAWFVVTAGITPTAGQNWVSLYSSAGTRLATTGVDADFAATGPKLTAITPQALAPGFYWASFLFNAATPPALMSGVSSTSRNNQLLPVAQLRNAVNGTALTTAPASIVPGSNTAVASRNIWSALGL